MGKIKNNKLFLLLPTLILPLGFLSGCAEETINDSALFFYISGSNLESEIGQATNLINALTSVKLPKGLEIYGLAGGSRIWHHDDIEDGSTTLFKIEDQSVQILENKTLDMGHQDTLEDYVKFSKSIQKSCKSLIFWGHGSPYGVCNDENFNNNPLTFRELDEGLGNSHFDYIMLNCCMGANLDLLTHISDNATYAIASEDNFPSAGLAYNAIIDSFSNQSLSLVDKGKYIIDKTKEKYDETRLSDTLTLSLINLSTLHDKIPYFNNYFYYANLDHQNFFQAVKLANNLGDYGKDFLDICYHVGSPYGGPFPDDIILYDVHGNREDINGLYIYYKNQISNIDLSYYVDNFYYQNYYNLLKRRVNYELGDYISFDNYVSNNDYIYEKKIIDSEFVSFIEYCIYDSNSNLLKKDTLGLDISVNNEQIFIGIKEESAFLLKLGDIVLNTSIYTFQESESKNIITYQVPCIYKEKNGNLLINYTYTDKPFEGSYEVLGFRYENKENYSSFFHVLEQGETLKFEDKEFVYSNQKVTKLPLEAFNINLYAEDIYGKVYKSNKSWINLENK